MVKAGVQLVIYCCYDKAIGIGRLLMMLLTSRCDMNLFKAQRLLVVLCSLDMIQHAS